MLLANTEGRKYAEISQHAEIRQSTEMSAPSLNPPLAINLSHSNNEEHALFQVKDGAPQNVPRAHLDGGTMTSIHLESLQDLACYGRRNV